MTEDDFDLIRNFFEIRLFTDLALRAIAEALWIEGQRKSYCMSHTLRRLKNVQMILNCDLKYLLLHFGLVVLSLITIGRSQMTYRNVP